jgi:hypothetical protein
LTPLLAGTVFVGSAAAAASPCGSAGYGGPWGCVLLPGSAWAPNLAGLGDLNVYNNGTNLTYKGPDLGYSWEYQCTELAVRYAALAWHEGSNLAKPEDAWYGAGWNGSAQDMWNVAPKLPVSLLRIANGISAPQFGDLIVFSESGGPGHVGGSGERLQRPLELRRGEPVLRPGRGADSNQLIELGEPGR